MKLLSPVVWSEGMHLAQHHFQTQSRYFEELTAFAVSNLFFRAYGLVRCELDAEALLNGTATVTHARGLMPDGLAFHFPEDPAPDPLEVVSLFSPVHDSHRLLLAIPPYRPNRANCALDGESDRGTLRFVSSHSAVPDEVTGADEKRVWLARKNFRLILDAQDTGDLVTMPIARIRRDGRGHFAYDPDYIPPCLQLAGSSRLLDMTARLVEMLDAKSDQMARERGGTQRAFAEWAAREVANFWFTHAINSAGAPIRHLLRTRAAHPERLYLEMARLAGALCTFSMEAHPKDLPSYEHDDPATTFDALERHIRRQLEMMIPSNTVVVALESAEQYFYRGPVSDDRCFARGAHWYLGFNSSSTRAEVVANVPRLVKICSAEHIVRLVKEGLPGLTIEHEPSPPSALSPRLGWQYFRIQTAGPCWTLMNKTRQAGVYVPGAFPDVQTEISIVLES
jgi:type VI secretion system protein ImpJ